jgi:hypothetical protein
MKNFYKNKTFLNISSHTIRVSFILFIWIKFIFLDNFIFWFMYFSFLYFDSCFLFFSRFFRQFIILISLRLNLNNCNTSFAQFSQNIILFISSISFVKHFELRHTIKSEVDNYNFYFFSYRFATFFRHLNEYISYVFFSSFSEI